MDAPPFDRNGPPAIKFLGEAIPQSTSPAWVIDELLADGNRILEYRVDVEALCAQSGRQLVQQIVRREPDLSEAH